VPLNIYEGSLALFAKEIVLPKKIFYHHHVSLMQMRFGSSLGLAINSSRKRLMYPLSPSDYPSFLKLYGKQWIPWLIFSNSDPVWFKPRKVWRAEVICLPWFLGFDRVNELGELSEQADAFVVNIWSSPRILEDFCGFRSGVPKQRLPGAVYEMIVEPGRLRLNRKGIASGLYAE